MVLYPTADCRNIIYARRDISGKVLLIRCSNVTSTLLGGASILTFLNGTTLIVFLWWWWRNKNWIIKVRVRQYRSSLYALRMRWKRRQGLKIWRIQLSTGFGCGGVVASREFKHCRVTWNAYIKLLQLIKNNCMQAGYIYHVWRHAPVFNSKRSSVCYFWK